MKREGRDELRELALAHSLHASTPLQELEEHGPLVFVKGEGSYLWDDQGRRYLDFRSGNFNCNLGYGNEEMAQAAYAQMLKLQYSASAGGWATEPLIRLAAKIASLLPPDLGRVLIMSSGSEAIEGAIKLARYVNRLEGKPEKFHVISRKLSYHGSSGGVIPITDSPLMQEFAAPLAPGFHLIERPYCYRCPLGKTYPSCEVDCARDLERTILELGPENVAAFIGEPIMVMGGVLAPPPEYWTTIREICTRYGVLLIADEVAQGLGRTGTLFGMQHWEIWPDLLVMSKGLGSGFFPVSAMVVSDDIYQRLRRARPDAGLWHFFTFTGHPVASAVALKSIEIVERRDLVRHAGELGEHLLRGLWELMDHPAVGDVRGIGLFAAIELVKDRSTQEALSAAEIRAFVRAIEEKGVLIRSFPPASYVVLAPPLTTTTAEIDSALGVLDDALGSLEPAAAPAR